MYGEHGLRHPGRREAVIAVAVAFLLVAVSWLAARGGEEPPAQGGLKSMASNPDDATVWIDLPGKITQAQVEQCMSDSATVLYARIQKTQSGQAAALVLRNPAGELRLCDSFGPDAPSVAPVQLADATHAVRLLSNGRQSFECDGARLSGLTLSHWLSVDEAVARAEMRFVIDGARGPWFSANAKDGYLHLHAWLGEQSSGAQVAVQTRFLDASGNTVAQDALPTGPQPVTGCAGGDVQLG